MTFRRIGIPTILTSSLATTNPYNIIIIDGVHSAYQYHNIIYNIAVQLSPGARENTKRAPREQRQNTIVV